MFAILMGPNGSTLLVPIMFKKLFPGIDITAFFLIKMGLGLLIFSVYKWLKTREDNKISAL